MLSSINPLGERGRGQRYWLTVLFYVLGSMLGGLLLGLVGGSLGMLLPSGPWRVPAIALVAAAGALADLVGLEPPSWRRQVDENWLSKYRGWVYGLGFGFQLGFGLVTIVTSASFYSLVAIAVLIGSFPTALSAGLLFGLARSVVILLGRDSLDPISLRAAMRRLQDGLGLARAGVIASQVVIVGSALFLLD